MPVEGWKRRSLDRRYPQALVDRLGTVEVNDLDNLRKQARLRAHFFTGALLACAEGNAKEAIALASMIDDGKGIRLRQDDSDDRKISDAQYADVVDALRQATEAVLGKTALDYITCLTWSPGAQQRAQEELFSLQADVGLGLGEFIEDFYDTVAFQASGRDSAAPRRC